MPVPFEALLPYAIMLGMFGVSGVGLTALKLWENGGKRPRYNTDQWDRQMMQRDQRLTGMLRGQTDKPYAPFGYELSSKWQLEPRIN